MNPFFILATPPCGVIVFYYSCKDIFAPASLENTPTHTIVQAKFIKKNKKTITWHAFTINLRLYLEFSACK